MLKIIGFFQVMRWREELRSKNCQKRTPNIALCVIFLNFDTHTHTGLAFEVHYVESTIFFVLRTCFCSILFRFQEGQMQVSI